MSFFSFTFFSFPRCEKWMWIITPSSCPELSKWTPFAIQCSLSSPVVSYLQFQCQHHFFSRLLDTWSSEISFSNLCFQGSPGSLHLSKCCKLSIHSRNSEIVVTGSSFSCTSLRQIPFPYRVRSMTRPCWILRIALSWDCVVTQKRRELKIIGVKTKVWLKGRWRWKD